MARTGNGGGPPVESLPSGYRKADHSPSLLDHHKFCGTPITVQWHARTDGTCIFPPTSERLEDFLTGFPRSQDGRNMVCAVLAMMRRDKSDSKGLCSGIFSHLA